MASVAHSKSTSLACFLNALAFCKLLLAFLFALIPLTHNTIPMPSAPGAARKALTPNVPIPASTPAAAPPALSIATFRLFGRALNIMADIFFENAIENAVMEVIRTSWAERPEYVLRTVRAYHIPGCTMEEVRESLQRLTAQKKLKIMKGYYAVPTLDRAGFLRFIYEG